MKEITISEERYKELIAAEIVNEIAVHALNVIPSYSIVETLCSIYRIPVPEDDNSYNSGDMGDA